MSTKKLGEACEQLRKYFEVRFRAEKYDVPYFLAESEAKRPTERGRRSKSVQPWPAVYGASGTPRKVGSGMGGFGLTYFLYASTQFEAIASWAVLRSS
jgi:hypothetical protein